MMDVVTSSEVDADICTKDVGAGSESNDDIHMVDIGDRFVVGVYNHMMEVGVRFRIGCRCGRYEAETGRIGLSFTGFDVWNMRFTR